VPKRSVVAGRHDGARRQLQGEHGSLAGLRLHVELETEQLDEPVHDAEPEPVTLASGIRLDADLVELVEDVRQVRARYAGAGVEDLYAKGARLVHAEQAHHAFASVLDGVGDEVAQDLFDERGIAVGAILAGIHLELDALVGCESRELGAGRIVAIRRSAPFRRARVCSG
jgi:hypothetical protein